MQPSLCNPMFRRSWTSRRRFRWTVSYSHQIQCGNITQRSWTASLLLLHKFTVKWKFILRIRETQPLSAVQCIVCATLLPQSSNWFVGSSACSHCHHVETHSQASYNKHRLSSYLIAVYYHVRVVIINNKSNNASTCLKGTPLHVVKVLSRHSKLYLECKSTRTPLRKLKSKWVNAFLNLTLLITWICTEFFSICLKIDVCALI